MSKSRPRGAERFLLPLALGLVYILLVGDLNLRASAIQTGLSMNIYHEIVGIIQPEVAWLQWTAIAITTVAAVGLISFNESRCTDDQSRSRRGPFIVFGTILLVATVTGGLLGLPDLSSSKDGFWATLLLLIQGFSISPAGSTAIALVVVATMRLPASLNRGSEARSKAVESATPKTLE